MSIHTYFRFMILSFLLLVFAACSSDIKKADIPVTANVQEEVGKLDTDINAAVLKNIDVLAKKEFNKTVQWFDDAKADLDAKKNKNDILESLRTGRGYLNQAYTVAGDQESKAVTLFQARQAALTAGAGMHPELRTQWKDVDSDVSSRAASLDSTDAETLIQLQNRYIDLEISAVKITQLALPQAFLIKGRKDGAIKRAPITYKKAEMSLKNAEAVIATNVRNPMGFQSAVNLAKMDATFLADVMTTFQKNGNDLPEQTAIDLVVQSQQIKKLKSTLTAAERAANESAAAEALLLENNKQLATALNSKDSDLSNAKASVEVQRAIETARQRFSADEAEAYQQGNSLLIRLKKVNFASGQAQIPGPSLPVLAKVSEVAKQLKASEIKVEGHTDSTGPAEKNKTISEERAQAVATYFKANGFQNIDIQASGFGFEKPIATNNSKEGRALNRRVDIIITPEGNVAE